MWHANAPGPGRHDAACTWAGPVPRSGAGPGRRRRGAGPDSVTTVVRQRIEYSNGLDRPDVEVLVDGVWCPGEVRMQTQLDDGTWELNVQWQPVGEQTRRIDTFPAELVRADTVDRSRGRS